MKKTVTAEAVAIAASSAAPLVAHTSKPRSGFMAILPERTVEYLKAALGTDEFRAVLVNANSAYASGKAVAIDIAFVSNKMGVPGSRLVTNYAARPNHRAVQLSHAMTDAVIKTPGDRRRWGLMLTPVERISLSRESYNLLTIHNPDTVKRLLDSKVVGLRFIVAYDQMPREISYNRVNAKTSNFIKTKFMSVEEPSAPSVNAEFGATNALTYDVPKTNDPDVDIQPATLASQPEQVDFAFTISVNGKPQREKTFHNLTALQLADMMVFMEGMFNRSNDLDSV